MPTSVVFLGTSAFAVPSLKALAKDPAFSVDLVITQPDRPVGRKQILTPSPVKIAAEELGLTIEQPENINKFQIPISKFQFLVVVSYGQILSQAILDLPTIAPVNVHASLLPLLRGASPLQHAILQGMETSGVTVQKIVKELDAGPILGQEAVPLSPRETFQTLHERLAVLGADLLLRTLKNPLAPQEQDHTKATHCKKLTKDDGIADPTTMTALQIDRMVRGLTPWPGVTWNGTKLLETSLEPVKNSLAITCAETTTLYAITVQPSGGRPMSGQDFANGRR